MVKMVKPGMVGCSYTPGVIQKIIRYFTNSQWSHSLLITTPVAGVESVHEAAGRGVQVVPFEKNYEKAPGYYQLYSISPDYATEDQIFQSLAQCHLIYSGDEYGTLQLLWFPYRVFMEKVFKKDVRHQKNWLSNGVICSELVYHFLSGLGSVFVEMLSPFSPDTIQSEDLYRMYETNPHIFIAVIPLPRA
jgi:hypothetical protein